MKLTEYLQDGEIISGAYELSKLLQFGCEHYGMEPTAANMGWMHREITTSAPLDRGAALEYAARLIADTAGELADGTTINYKTAEAALEALEAE